MSLPSGYTLLEYIESTGTQYIDTGFNPTFATRVKMECEPLAQTDDNACLFGARATKSATASNMFIVWTMSAGATVRSDYFGTNVTGSTSITEQRVSIDKNRNVYTDGYNTLTNTAKTSGTCAYPLYVFCLNNVGTAEYYKASQLSSLQIYDADVLVRDFIPCKNSVGDIGLWDDVNSQFYANAGTGTFIAGPVVNLGGIFVKVDGEWKQISNVTVNVN